MSDGAGPPASVLLRVGFFLVAGAILFVLFERFGPYQPGRGYHPRPIETLSAAGAVLDRTIDGHFYLSGRINGTSVAFLVDTGASTVAIGETLAEQLDLGACRSRRYSTAAGTVTGCEASARQVEVAGLRLADVPVAVLPGADNVLLGMNVLKHFRIEQQGRQMRLTPIHSPGTADRQE
ncbi:MAG TPA: retropepsin-like aspartic protease [Lautropia sp.]|jgi:clan AA aspartic protease (TIGR02281 family)|nr:retropepsin-like aspartic protease [Lautropia sp.]